uniref:Transmembrane protein n=1 Tax=Oryza rufipogon TaxID=4529 RepID=A0A1D8I1W2_ORYRU|nr:transmembrane protein [Oryza rufipogon]
MTRDRMRQSIKGRALCRAFSSRSAGGVIFKVVLKSLQERKKRISSEISSTIYFYMLCIPYLIFFLKISILVFLVFYRIVLPIVQMFSLLTCCSFLILILLFCLILTCLILFRLKKKEDFASPPESIISIFSSLFAILMAVLASGPSVVQAMDHPPVGGSPSEAGPEGSAAPPSSSFQESTGEMDALMASTTPSAPRTPSGGEPSVNQPLPGEQAMPPALPVMQEAANRAPPYAPYPYPVDEIIGGDSVQSIQRRLLGTNWNPSAHDIKMSRIQAEDLFELKVEIIRKMAGLHPSGDWMGWGARALDNPRTATGEEDLARLHQMLDDLQSRNEQSATFWRLVERVRLRADEDQNSAS